MGSSIAIVCLLAVICSLFVLAGRGLGAYGVCLLCSSVRDGRQERARRLAGVANVANMRTWR